MSFYIYKHILNDEVVYVGKTINMKSRQKQHSKNKAWFSEKIQIEYAEVSDSMLMEIYEKYYISKYSPIYNIKDVNCKYSKFFKSLDELEFKIYVNINIIKTKPIDKTLDNKVIEFSESFENYYRNSLEVIKLFRVEFKTNGSIVDNLACVKNYVKCDFDIRNRILWGSKTKLYSSDPKNKIYKYHTFGTSLNLNNYSHLKTEEQRNYKSLDDLWNEIFKFKDKEEWEICMSKGLTNCSWNDGDIEDEEDEIEEWL